MDGLIGQLENVLAELDMISIGFEQSGQWDAQSKIGKVIVMVKKAIGDRNGIQSPSGSTEVLQQSSGAPQVGSHQLEACSRE